MQVVSKYNPLEHYKWGSDCDGWRMVNDPGLSVIQERMPAGTSEKKHFHRHAQQFFFILKGIASFEIEDKIIEVRANEGLHIQPGKKHRIMNRTEEELEFVLCSQPSTAGDRIEESF
jgi:mannose-6-phosphate isomerase-like protein (cupin superfamily)